MLRRPRHGVRQIDKLSILHSFHPLYQFRLVDDITELVVRQHHVLGIDDDTRTSLGAETWFLAGGAQTGTHRICADARMWSRSERREELYAHLK